ncbi:MAG: lipoprotein-releasing ABC transporter permease subunit [Deltaproteobacteria bacterium]|nr:MAG: lipoprotein-releasing ABC transporter permease subunit [Deltaproteobacteria bacterium]
MAFEYFIGARYLRARQKQSFISLITILSIAGVTVGVMALIVVIAVMTGFESDLKTRILGIESHLVVRRHGEPISNFREIRRQVAEIPGVAAATPALNDQVMLRSAGGISGAMFRGVDVETAGGVINVLTPDLLDRLRKPPSDNGSGFVPPGIILGKQLGRQLGVVEGDIVYIISPRGMLIPAGHIPGMHRFKVVGFFESGMYEFDGALAYILLSEAQRMMRMPHAVSGIDVRLYDAGQAESIAARINDTLGFPFWSQTWMQMNKNLFSALKLEKVVMFIILALIVLVAAFNIASSLIMMVMEKTRDVAILKAMGATNRSIRKIFVFKGLVIGIVGTTLGVIFGFILCGLLEKYKFIELPGDVYYLTTLPVQLEMSDVAMIAVSAIVICFLATLYPAGQAARLDPVDAIRYG